MYSLALSLAAAGVIDPKAADQQQRALERADAREGYEQRQSRRAARRIDRAAQVLAGLADHEQVTADRLREVASQRSIAVAEVDAFDLRDAVERADLDDGVAIVNSQGTIVLLLDEVV